MPDTNPILIVGAGPSGLMMACQLSLRGVPFCIIDKTADHTTQSRALVVHARTLEIFDQMGIAQRAIGEGKIARDIVAVFSGRSEAHIALGDFGQEFTHFPYLLILEQSKTEALLEAFLAEQGHSVERNTELLALAQDEGGVSATLRLADGREQKYRAAYAVGADGAHSVVREAMGVAFGGTTYKASMYVLDCRVDFPLPPDRLYGTLSPSALTLIVPLTNGRSRLIGTLPEAAQDKEHVTFEDIEQGIDKRVHMKLRIYDPQWLSVYHSHHRYASHFRAGHCFLAGDAAHIHSPVGAQGMNTGLQDAYNLAWKLALASQGRATEALLDSYEAERMAVAKTLVHTTDRIFHFMISKNPLVNFLRLHVLPLVLRFLAPSLAHGELRKTAFRRLSQVGIHYRDGPLAQDASEGMWPIEAPMPGDRVPAPAQWRLHDTDFHLLLFIGSGDGSAFDALIHAAKKYAGIVAVDMLTDIPANTAIYQAFGVREGAFLIRPDMHIAWRSASGDAKHFAAYMRRFLRH